MQLLPEIMVTLCERVESIWLRPRSAGSLLIRIIYTRKELLRSRRFHSAERRINAINWREKRLIQGTKKYNIYCTLMHAGITQICSDYIVLLRCSYMLYT